MKFLPVIVVFALAPAYSYAQGKIEPERPSESQSPNTVQRSVFQAEFGFRKEQKDETDYKVQHPNALFRYGIANKIELRLQTAIESDRFPSKDKYHYGLMPVEPGFKTTIYQAKDTSFTVGVVGQVGIPKLAAHSHEAEKAFHRIRVLFENQLSEKIKIHYNAGTDWDEEEQEQEWVYTVTPEFELSEKWDAFVEDYAFIHKHAKPQHYLNAGVSYSVNNNLKIDVSGRKGISSEASKYIIATGLSFKL